MSKNSNIEAQIAKVPVEPEFRPLTEEEKLELGSFLISDENKKMLNQQVDSEALAEPSVGPKLRVVG